MRLLNLELMKHPANWIVIPLMVAIAAYAWSLVDPLKTRSSNYSQGSPP